MRQGRDYVREKVRERDSYTCQDCKKVRTPEFVTLWGVKSFDVHHLHGLCGKKSKGYDSINEMEGLITLCHKCHYNRHDFEGNSFKAKTHERFMNQVGIKSYPHN